MEELQQKEESLKQKEETLQQNEETLKQNEEITELNEQDKPQGEVQQKNQPSYKQKEYWNDRYKVKDTYYDWYCGYPELKTVFEKCYNLAKDAKILMIGCGNSKLSEDMFDDGYTNIVSTDISDVVIDQLKRNTEEKLKNLIFSVQDCTNLTYEDSTFDFVFDKGTLDALSCDLEGESVNKMLQEMTRVCKPNGSVVIVSFGLLHERRFIFEESLGFEKYSYQLCKKYLSIDSQLTNIMRHISNGLPMPLILKNKELLFQTLVELRKIKGALNNEVIKTTEIDWENLVTVDELIPDQQQDIHNQISNTVDEENKQNNIITQNDTKQDSNLDEENQENHKNNQIEGQQKEQAVIEIVKPSLKCQTESFPNENINNLEDSKVQQNKQLTEQKNSKEDEEDSEDEETEDNDNEDEDEKEGKSKFRRQTQCFIYRIQYKQ